MKVIKINEIEGFRIGHAQNTEGGTGCTAIICENGAVAGVDVRGGGPATRETDLLNSSMMCDRVHGIMLSGGSAYGLEAACGMMEYLEERSIGFDVGIGKVPIVPAASLFDLIVGDSKCRPDKKMGYEACVNSELNIVKNGNVGAGTGATIGKYLGIQRAMKGGLGCYAVQIGSIKIGAIVAVNALGDIYDFETGKQIAGMLDEEGKTLINTQKEMWNNIEKKKNVFSGNTTISCIITNSALTKAQCNKLASVTHNGYAATIKPVHTSADGDTVFCLSNGNLEADIDTLGDLSAYVMSKAIITAIKNAKTAYGVKAMNDILI